MAPPSSLRVSDFVPDLNNSNGFGRKKSKKSDTKNGTGVSASQPVVVPTPTVFEDPAYAAFEKLRRMFPTVPKAELEDLFNSNEGEINDCACKLMERGEVPYLANRDEVVVNDDNIQDDSASRPVVLATPPVFEDPAHAAFETLKRMFPSVPKVELEDLFNSNKGDIDDCAWKLMDRGEDMVTDYNIQDSSASQPAVVPPVFEDPAYVDFEKLRRMFPSVLKAELEDLFNSNEGDINDCAGKLMDKGETMMDDNDNIENGESDIVGPVESFTDAARESESEENGGWDTGSDSPDVSSSRTPTEVDAVSQQDDDDILDLDALTDDSDFDAEGLEAEVDADADKYNMVLPAEFARVLLHAFGHPEDENCPLNLGELTIKISADTAFEIYTGLYKNMHNTATGMDPGGSATNHSSEESLETTRSNSPILSRENELDELAITLSQMDLEMSSGDPQLPTIIDIESKLQQHKQESTRKYSAPYRTMAQTIKCTLLKERYSQLDPGIIDEVYSQCMLNVEKTKAALNEMYPQSTSNQHQDCINNPSSSTNRTFRYLPKDVQFNFQQVLDSMQMTDEEMEKDWDSKMDKCKDYKKQADATSDKRKKAYCITEANKLRYEMIKLKNDIEYYRAVRFNAKQKDKNVLDLHGLTVNGARRILKDFLQWKEHEFLKARIPKMILSIITGQGKHSRNGPVLQPAVRNFLQENSYKFHTEKPGSYNVVLTRGFVTRHMW